MCYVLSRSNPVAWIWVFDNARIGLYTVHSSCLRSENFYLYYMLMSVYANIYVGPNLNPWLTQITEHFDRNIWAYHSWNKRLFVLKYMIIHEISVSKNKMMFVSCPCSWRKQPFGAWIWFAVVFGDRVNACPSDTATRTDLSQCTPTIFNHIRILVWSIKNQLSIALNGSFVSSRFAIEMEYMYMILTCSG